MAKTQTIGEVVKEFRTKKLLLQEELAKKSKLSLQTIRDIEQGVQKRYTEITLYKLEYALDLPTGFLVKKQAKLLQKKNKGE